MNKTEHTPSPWNVVKMGNIVTGVGASCKTTRGCYSEMVCNSILPDTDKEYTQQKARIEADMKLIAAAPELLEALEWCVETFDGLAVVYPSLDNERGFARAKAVIKKAKGENV